MAGSTRATLAKGTNPTSNRGSLRVHSLAIRGSRFNRATWPRVLLLHNPNSRSLILGTDLARHHGAVRHATAVIEIMVRPALIHDDDETANGLEPGGDDDPTSVGDAIIGYGAYNDLRLMSVTINASLKRKS